jgi:hypothetical protein
VEWGLLHHRDRPTPATEAFHQAAQDLLHVGAVSEG